MADVQKNTNSVVSWIALALSIIALPIAITAYNRSGEDLDTTIEKKTAVVVNETQDTASDVADELQEAREEVQESAEQLRARAEFQTRLMQIQVAVNTDAVTDQTVTEIQDIRSDFRDSYADATGDLRTQVDQMDQDLAQLETQVREDTAGALANIEIMLERLRRDVLTDEGDAE